MAEYSLESGIYNDGNFILLLLVLEILFQLINCNSLAIIKEVVFLINSTEFIYRFSLKGRGKRNNIE